MILARLGLKPDFLGISESRKKYFSESLSYSYNNQIIAEAGKISRSTLKKFDIGQDVYYAHLEWELILTIIKHNVIRYRELPKYPAVRRDLALLVNSDVRFSRIRELAYKAEKDILRDVSLFDVYESETLGRNKKSYAVSFILQDEQRTLTDKSIDKVMNNFIRIFEKELDAHIR
jgi:phenylalanyl-tRNA synthetase beta chain